MSSQDNTELREIKIFSISPEGGWSAVFEEEKRFGFYIYRVWLTDGMAHVEIRRSEEGSLIRFPGTIDNFGDISLTVIDYVRLVVGSRLSLFSKETNAFIWILEKTVMKYINWH